MTNEIKQGDGPDFFFIKKLTQMIGVYKSINLVSILKVLGKDYLWYYHSDFDALIMAINKGAYVNLIFYHFSPSTPDMLRAFFIGINKAICSKWGADYVLSLVGSEKCDYCRTYAADVPVLIAVLQDLGFPVSDTFEQNEIFIENLPNGNTVNHGRIHFRSDAVIHGAIQEGAP